MTDSGYPSSLIPVPAPDAEPDYGVDWSTYPDLSWTEIHGIEVLAQSIARSLEDAELGVDLRSWLNDTFEAGTDGRRVSELRQAIVSQCLADERIADAAVEIVVGPRTLDVDVTVVPALGGPFSLTLSVTQLTVDLVRVQELQAP